MEAGAMKKYSGVLFERRDDGAFVLSQRQYLLNVLQRFGMEYCEPCATLCVPKKTMDEASTDMSYTTFSFREAVGSLLYLAAHTRPDISLTVGMLGRAMVAPSAQDVVAVKRLMRYLSGTRDYGLLLSGTGESTLIAYSDADWGGDVDRKSKPGELHYFGEDVLRAMNPDDIVFGIWNEPASRSSPSRRAQCHNSHTQFGSRRIFRALSSRLSGQHAVSKPGNIRKTSHSWIHLVGSERWDGQRRKTHRRKRGRSRCTPSHLL
jgi:hypothetical protein